MVQHVTVMVQHVSVTLCVTCLSNRPGPISPDAPLSGVKLAESKLHTIKRLIG